MLLWHTLLIFSGWWRRLRHLQSLINILIGPSLTLSLSFLFSPLALFSVLLSSWLLLMCWIHLHDEHFILGYATLCWRHNRCLLKWQDCCYISLLITHFLFLLSCLICSQISQMLGNEMKFAVREPIGLRWDFDCSEQLTVNTADCVRSSVYHFQWCNIL